RRGPEGRAPERDARDELRGLRRWLVVRPVRERRHVLGLRHPRLQPEGRDHLPAPRGHPARLPFLIAPLPLTSSCCFRSTTCSHRSPWHSSAQPSARTP